MNITSPKVLQTIKSVLLLLLLSIAVQAQTNPGTGYPLPPPGAPATACSMDGVDASAPVRILLGPVAIPYAYACAQHPGKPCIGGTLAPGLVVSVAATSGEWSCVSGGDSTSGWVPTSSLAELPTTPRVPLEDWIGWWRNGPDVPNIENDRILITRGASPGTLHISGRAFWYGINDNVHFGEIRPTEVKPVGPYLHIVDGDTLSSCIVDLHLEPATHTFNAYDNDYCGGMNARFLRTCSRFTPANPKARLQSH